MRTAEEIGCRLHQNPEIERPFYFLHGGFHIYRMGSDKENYRYFKVQTGKSSFQNYQKELKKRIEEITEIVIKGHKPNAKTIGPLFVFEDRSWVKEKVIYRDPYLSVCFDSLKKLQGHLFIYGCSFERDQHILKAILKSACNEIYISYLKNDEQPKNRVRDYLHSENINQDRIYWVVIKNNEEKLIWTGNWGNRNNNSLSS